MAISKLTQPNYWYEEAQILELLCLYIKDNKIKNVKYIELYVRLELFDYRKLFLSQINMINYALKNKHQVAVVCHLNNNHYTTLFFKPSVKLAIYIDSLGRPMPYEIKSCINQWNYHLMDYETEKFVQQRDGFNCGPLTAFNLITLIKGDNISLSYVPDLQQLRQAQYDTLHNHGVTNAESFKYNGDINNLTYLARESGYIGYDFLPFIDAREDSVYDGVTSYELNNPEVHI